MLDYDLTIQFATADAEQVVAAGQRVAIVKETRGSTGNSTIWVAFRPMEKNEVKWTQRYGVYASATGVQAGAMISKLSAVNPARSGLYYPFENGRFGDPKERTGEDNYGIFNRYDTPLTFGLAQSVTANGCRFEASPLNAIAVLSSQKATYTPIEIVRVFLVSAFNSGVVATSVTGSVSTVDLTSDSSQTVHFDGAVGGFKAGALLPSS